MNNTLAFMCNINCEMTTVNECYSCYEFRGCELATNKICEMDERIRDDRYDKKISNNTSNIKQPWIDKEERDHRWWMN